MGRVVKLLKEKQGVVLEHLVLHSDAKTVGVGYGIRSARTKEIWCADSLDEATRLFEEEVVRCSNWPEFRAAQPPQRRIER